MQPTEDRQAGEATADAPTDGTTRPPKPCRFCQVPVTQPKRWDREKDFCSDRHRTAYHTAERRREVMALTVALEELAGELDRQQAAVSGFRARLAATLPRAYAMAADLNDKARQADLIATVEARAARLAAADQDTSWKGLCPGCSGEGVLTDDPQVLRCQGCGGVFTNPAEPITIQQALKFVRIGKPMLANANEDGTFYFDLDILDVILADGTVNRSHGWADAKTKLVVQYG